MITDFERRAGLSQLVSLIDSTPERRLLVTVITAGCRYWATDPALVRTIIATAATESDAAHLLDQHDLGRRRLLQRLVGRLASAGLVAAECPRQHALDTLWLVTGFAAYDELARGRGRSTVAAARTLVAIAEKQILAADAPAE